MILVRSSFEKSKTEMLLVKKRMKFYRYHCSSQF